MAHSTTDQAMPESVRLLISNIEAAGDLTPASTKRLLQESTITPEDLMGWSDFDHPQADSYGRKLVHDGGYFELMVMSWVDGDMAAIHDHGHTQWGAVKLFGPAEHAVFQVQEGLLRTTDRRVFETDTVLAVSHDMIHQMGNIGQAPYLTLHLYGCYGCEKDVTGDARLYELDEGKIQRTSGGVFYSLPEDAVDRREDCPQADFSTWLRHQVELVRRLLITHDGLAKSDFCSTRAADVSTQIFAEETWERCGDAWEMEMSNRSREIFRQDLFATARLQRDLLAAGMMKSEIFQQAALDDLLKQGLEEFADAYLSLAVPAVAEQAVA